jgi:hypothetical protein
LSLLGKGFLGNVVLGMVVLGMVVLGTVGVSIKLINHMVQINQSFNQARLKLIPFHRAPPFLSIVLLLTGHINQSHGADKSIFQPDTIKAHPSHRAPPNRSN